MTTAINPPGRARPGFGRKFDQPPAGRPRLVRLWQEIRPAGRQPTAPRPGSGWEFGPPAAASPRPARLRQKIRSAARRQAGPDQGYVSG